MTPFPSLDPIMKPKSIALIGASTKEHTIGSDILKRLIEYGFTGALYPVNPKAGIIGGLKAYASVKDIAGPVDLAIVVINAKHVLLRNRARQEPRLKRNHLKSVALTKCAASALTAWVLSIHTLPFAWTAALPSHFPCAATSALCPNRGLWAAEF